MITIIIIADSSNCKKATGKGNNTATIEPKVGMKLSKKVKVPKIKAKSNPINQ